MPEHRQSTDTCGGVGSNETEEEKQLSLGFFPAQRAVYSAEPPRLATQLEIEYNKSNHLFPELTHLLNLIPRPNVTEIFLEGEKGSFFFFFFFSDRKDMMVLVFENGDGKKKSRADDGAGFVNLLRQKSRKNILASTHLLNLIPPQHRRGLEMINTSGERGFFRWEGYDDTGFWREANPRMRVLGFHSYLIPHNATHPNENQSSSGCWGKPKKG